MQLLNGRLCPFPVQMSLRMHVRWATLGPSTEARDKEEGEDLARAEFRVLSVLAPSRPPAAMHADLGPYAGLARHQIAVGFTMKATRTKVR